jgi:hypothetical protein
VAGRKKAREQAALAHQEAALDRLQWQLTELRGHLDRCAKFHAIMAAEFMGEQLARLIATLFGSELAIISRP